MKILLAAPFIFLSATSWAQRDSLINPDPQFRSGPADRQFSSDLQDIISSPSAFEPHTATATLALGFIDNYRTDLPLPPGFIKTSTSGFAPVMAKLEYNAGMHISIAGTFGYDHFVYNLQQVYEGNNGSFTRYLANDTRILSGGVSAFYHFRRLLPVSHFDPFIGAGAAINNIRYSAYPQGDSVAIKTDHTVTPYLKAGIRYYVSYRSSLYGDVGYDKQAVISLGFSVRFLKKGYHHHYASYHAPSDFEGHHQETVIPINKVRADSNRIADHSYPDTITMQAMPAEDHSDRVATEQPQENLILPISVIQFQLGKFVVAASSQAYLDEVAALLQRNPDADLYIDGYADTTGTAAINNRISLARAQTIKKYLAGRGVAAGRLIVKGHGSNAPAAGNRTRAGRAKNRRVTLKLKYDLPR